MWLDANPRGARKNGAAQSGLWAFTADQPITGHGTANHLLRRPAPTNRERYLLDVEVPVFLSLSLFRPVAYRTCSAEDLMLRRRGQLGDVGRIVKDAGSAWPFMIMIIVPYATPYFKGQHACRCCRLVAGCGLWSVGHQAAARAPSKNL